MHKVNLKETLTLFSEHWSPRIVGELNGQHVKLAKLQGERVSFPSAKDKLPVAVAKATFVD